MSNVLPRLARTGFIAALLASFAVASAAWGQQAYPSRPVKLLIPYATGGAVDMMGRLLAKEFTELNGQPYVVENKGGAGGAIAATAAAQAAPDGYTVFIGATGPNTITPAVYGSKVGFDPIKGFVPISLIATTPYVLVVNPSIPVKSVPELIAYSKANEGKVSYASSGTGGPDHLGGELFKILTGVSDAHVPYRGSGPALSDLVAGQVQYTFVSPLPAMPLVEAGKLRLLAVTGTTRSKAMPDVPTVAEAVPGFEVLAWYGLFVPAGTPKAVSDKIGADLKTVMAREHVRDVFSKRGLEPATNSPPEFSAFVASELAKWSKIVKDAKVKPEE